MNRNLATIMRMLGTSSSNSARGNENEQEDESQVDPETLNMSRIVRSIYLSRQI